MSTDSSSVVHPWSMALRFVKYDSREDAVLQVRRSRAHFIRRWAVYSVLVAAVVALVPLLVVLVRAEPAYLTNWVLVVFGIGFLLLAGLGTLGAVLWSRSAAGRGQFDESIMTITPNGVTLPGTGGLLEWDRISAMRLYGRRRVSLAVTVEPPAPGVEPVPEAEPEPDDEPETDDLVDVTGHFTGQAEHAPKPEPEPIVQPEAKAEAVPKRDGWAEGMYGATHRVDLRGASPSVQNLSDTIAALTHGRIRLR